MKGTPRSNNRGHRSPTNALRAKRPACGVTSTSQDTRIAANRGFRRLGWSRQRPAPAQLQPRIGALLWVSVPADQPALGHVWRSPTGSKTNRHALVAARSDPPGAQRAELQGRRAGTSATCSQIGRRKAEPPSALSDVNDVDREGARGKRFAKKRSSSRNYRLHTLRCLSTAPQRELVCGTSNLPPSRTGRRDPPDIHTRVRAGSLRPDHRRTRCPPRRRARARMCRSRRR